ncbi:cytosine permease [Lysinibacillus sp. MHQ-1]|nr:cytosine permease [Lysinibacillus sp. MHQ-1]
MRNDNNVQSWYSLGIIWGGAMICIPSLLVGNTLITSMSLSKALAVAFVGYAIVVFIMVLQGMQSSDLGRPTVHVAGQVFGKKRLSYDFIYYPSNRLLRVVWYSG